MSHFEDITLGEAVASLIGYDLALSERRETAEKVGYDVAARKGEQY